MFVVIFNNNNNNFNEVDTFPDILFLTLGIVWWKICLLLRTILALIPIKKNYIMPL